eukprot:s608_g8.t1
MSPRRLALSFLLVRLFHRLPLSYRATGKKTAPCSLQTCSLALQTAVLNLLEQPCDMIFMDSPVLDPGGTVPSLRNSELPSMAAAVSARKS